MPTNSSESSSEKAGGGPPLSRLLHSRPAPTSIYCAIPTQLFHISANAKWRFQSLEQPLALPSDYTIQLHDVICWPKGVCSCDTTWNAGNERFKIIVQMRVERYRHATSRLGKMKLCKEGVEAVRDAGGRFVRRVSRTTTAKDLNDMDVNAASSAISWQWVDIGNKCAREKVGHALRQEVVKHGKRQIESSSKSSKRPSTKRCSFSDESWSTQETCTSTRSSSDSRRSASSPEHIHVVEHDPPLCDALCDVAMVPDEGDDRGLLLLANRVWCPFESEL
jgi:hypothetical protein